ncbi:MAG: PIN/TRAM domain-containing protein, partial [Anaerolineales bacterium]
MSVEFIFRIVGMILFAILGSYLGVYLAGIADGSSLTFGVLFSLLGALFGLIMTPFFTTRPAKAIGKLLSRVSAQTLLAGLIGLLAGLIVAALAAFPLSLLPEPFRNILPFIGVLLFSYLGVTVVITRQSEIFSMFHLNLSGRRGALESDGKDADDSCRTILLDTSVIIDGRIADVARTGFLVGTLMIPRFVLNELQYIADSPDSLRRQRGRRGIEVLSQLQKNANIPVRISDLDVEGAREVDDKLVILARQLRCPILTNDYNLNRVADLQGVAVLNVNELANAVKSVLLP